MIQLFISLNNEQRNITYLYKSPGRCYRGYLPHRHVQQSSAIAAPQRISSATNSSPCSADAAACCSKSDVLRSKRRCRSTGNPAPASPLPKYRPAKSTSRANSCARPSPRSAEIAINRSGPADAPWIRSTLFRTAQTGVSEFRQPLFWIGRLRAGVDQPAPDRSSRPSPRPAHPPPHRISRLANAGGVDDRHRITVEVELHLDERPGWCRHAVIRLRTSRRAS